MIGGGSGGVRCARMAARLGVRVACIESRFWGGTCVNVGCVPKKLYAIGSAFSTSVARARGFGWEVQEPSLRWEHLQAAVHKEVNRLSGVYDNILDSAGVTRLWGKASLAGKHKVEVDGRVITAQFIVIATGAHSRIPNLPGIEHTITSDGFFAMQNKPARAIVIGGGYIAVELASILAAAGSEVTILYRGETVLRGFDDEVREHLQGVLQARGIRILTHAQVASIDKAESGYRVTFAPDAGVHGVAIEADCVINATGRTPNSASLNLGAAEIEPDGSGAISVDEHFRTSTPNIFAVGDVLHRMQLTPVALAEGMYVAHYLFGKKAPAPIQYGCVASTVFSQPQVASVGLTEQACMVRGRKFRVYRSRFTPMQQVFANRQEKTFLKMLVDDASDVVLGIHIIGDDAGEIMQGFAAAMVCGATKAQLDATIGIHPTIAEELVTMREVSETVDPLS
ncbi:glutathione-disulfide reductase [gamma proteobacterium HdN1]|nr:glutathione-disulfide reductase [gamma proteobacterium HdN1]